MKTAMAFCMFGWGGLMGSVTAAMTGVYWELPYFGAAGMVGVVGTFVALAGAR